MAGLYQRGRELEKWRLGRSKLYGLGKIYPLEEPTFGPAAETIRTQGERTLENLPSILSESGITGPGAGLIMERAGQGVGNQILDLVNMMQGKGEREIDWGTDLAQRLRNYQLQLAQLSEQRKGRHLQEDIARTSGITSGFGSGMSGAGSGLGSYASAGGGCCFIFIQGEGELTEDVRIARDYLVQNYKDGLQVALGYCVMAKHIVPLMKKYRPIQFLVRFFMTKPMTIFARWLGWKNRLGFVFLPVAMFWLVTWSVIGGISKRPLLSLRRV